MKLKTIRLFVAVCIIFILFAVGAWFIKAYKMPPELVENSVIKNESGVPVRISDFKGQYVLLSYFQTWCGDCISELGSMDVLQTKVGKDKIKIIMVSDESWEKINRFKEKYCNTLNYYRSEEKLNSQNIRIFPTSYLLNKEGSILMSKIQAYDWSSDEVLKQLK